MAIVAGFNILILAFFNCICRYFVSKHFKQTLRQEVKGGDLESKTIMTDLKKSILPIAREEKMIHDEINKHLSLANLYEMSKVVQAQHHKIYEHQMKIERLERYTHD